LFAAWFKVRAKTPRRKENEGDRKVLSVFATFAALREICVLASVVTAEIDWKKFGSSCAPRR
jgi:hypothetical protein